MKRLHVLIAVFVAGLIVLACEYRRHTTIGPIRDSPVPVVAPDPLTLTHVLIYCGIVAATLLIVIGGIALANRIGRKR